MPTFGLITEGVTDQVVIENIVAGIFDDEAEVNPLQPLGDATHRGTAQSFGGWELVLGYCSSTEFEQAFQFNDYLVVQIDTEECEHTNYGVPRRRSDGVDLTPEEIIQRVREKIIGIIGEQVWSVFGSRIVFAITVDSIECWILVLHARTGSKTKYLNCEAPLQRELRRRNISATPSNKNIREYDTISRDFSKGRRLVESIVHNDGLRIFVAQLQEINSPHTQSDS